jgi:adenine deaminase
MMRSVADALHTSSPANPNMLRNSLVFLLAYSQIVAAQSPAPLLPVSSYVIRAAHMIDGRSDAIQNDVAVVVVGDRIVAVGPRSQLASRIPAGAQTIDLGSATILPGLIDNHTHVLL